MFLYLNTIGFDIILDLNKKLLIRFRVLLQNQRVSDKTV